MMASSATRVQTKFDPNPGDFITLFGDVYEFMPNPKVPRFAFAVEGRKASVFRLKAQRGGDYALKVFTPAHRSTDSSRAIEALKNLASLKGLTAAGRKFVDPGSAEAAQWTDLSCAVLMPWIGSKTWANILGDSGRGGKLQLHKCRRLAVSFLEVMAALEAARIAHTDISPGNVAIDIASARVELLDLEDIYSSQLAPPTRPAFGTDGYRHKTAEPNAGTQPRTTWCAEGDRYSSAILAAELLCLSNPQLAQVANDDGLFRGNTNQPESQKRFSLAITYLESVAPAFATSFRQAWNAETLLDCPRISELLEAVQKLMPTPAAAAIVTASTPTQTPKNHLKPRLAWATILALFGFSVFSHDQTEKLASALSSLAAEKSELVSKLSDANQLQTARLAAAQSTPVAIGRIELTGDFSGEPKNRFTAGSVKYICVKAMGPNQFYGLQDYATTIGVKFVKVDGTNDIPESNSTTSPPGLTLNLKVTMSSNEPTWKSEWRGWGDDKGIIYSSPGRYRIEFYHQGREIAETRFEVEEPSIFTLFRQLK